MKIRSIVPTAAILMTAACASDGLGPRPLVTKNVGLSFGVLGTVPTSASAAELRTENGRRPKFANSAVSGDTLIVSTATDTMRITSIQLTIEEIELERDGQTVSCSDSSSSSGDSSRTSVSFRRGSDDDDRDSDDASDDDSGRRGRGRHDDCEDHIGGPVLVNLNIDGTGTSQITVPAVLGVYDTLEFDFDVADESNGAHAAYRAAHPEMANASARIIGTFNGTPFELKLDSRLKYEVALTMPLVVTDGSTGFELGIRIDVGAWLLRPNGSLIDPLNLCGLGSRCIDREIIEDNMDNARVRADGRRRGRD